MGSSLGPRFGSGLGSGSARARDYFYRALFGLGSVQGPDRGQGVDITIPVTCSVFEPDPMTSQCTRGVPRLKFGHKIHEMWVFFSFVAIASQKFYRRVAKHHFCLISHGATPGPDDVTGQGDLAGWPYLFYRALDRGWLRSGLVLGLDSAWLAQAR